MKFVLSSSSSCPPALHFVSLYYSSAGSLLRSHMTHQHRNLITQKPLGKITKRHSNHCDSTAGGNVKTSSLLSLCHHASHPWGWILYFLPLWPLLAPLTPLRKPPVGGLSPGRVMAAPWTDSSTLNYPQAPWKASVEQLRHAHCHPLCVPSFQRCWLDF